MKIDKIHIKNFTVFEDIEIKLNEGINVFIGQNGTGKTHLLKLLYGVRPVRKTIFFNHKIAMPLFRSKVDKLIQNENETVATAWSNNVDESYEVFSSTTVYFKDSSLNYLEYSIEESQDVKEYDDFEEYYKNEELNNLAGYYDDNISFYKESISYNGDIPGIDHDYTFIPAKEILSHSKGLLALNNRFDLPFDETYIDIITSAELPEVKNISESSLKIINVITKIIGGNVVNEDGNFYINKKNKKIEFSLEAEGLRKFGLLWKLIMNGLIEKNSFLIWDEPEANLNPELLPTLAKILLALEREGVQIFIATHSYNLTKYLELFREKKSSVGFYNLYKVQDKVNVDSKEYFGNLKNNSIIDSDFDLYEDIIESTEDDSWKKL